MTAGPRACALATLAALAAGVLAGPAAAAPVSAADGLRAVPAPRRALPRALPTVAADPLTAAAWQLGSADPLGAWGAWAQTTGGDVTVAILDTGADLTHPDLAPNLWTNPSEIPGNGRDDDHDGVVDDVHGVDLVNHDGDPADDNGHGTHVAGIVGARGGNGIGLSGVAWRVRLMPVKVLDAHADGSTATVAQGLRWAVAHGAQVINLSLAGPDRAPELDAAIAFARAAGVLVVTAAGNAHEDLGLHPAYPASSAAPNVLGVAASGQDGLLSLVSSFGGGVDLMAPGDDILSTALGGGYEVRSGTSMAAPMVAGAAALVLAAHPDADAAGVAQALLAGARRSVLPVGAGALDAGRAVAETVPAAGLARPLVVAISRQP